VINMSHRFQPVLPARALAPLHDIEVDPARVKAIIEKVRQIEIRIRGLVDSSLAGSYHAAFRGRGIDFDSVREYVPGDEVRTIDWNVTARAGRPFIKQFREERELTMMLLVDVSASGEFGSNHVRKRELAAELACVLALSATRNNDRVGLILFSDQIERFVPPGKGRSHALRVVREILGCKPDGRGTDLGAALRLAGSIMRRRTSMFLISDLELGPNREAAMHDLQRAARPVGARHDVIALHVRDPHERTLPDVGLVTIEDAETGEVLSIDTSRKNIRDKFTKLAQVRAAETKLVLRRANVETVEIDTAKSYVPVLLDFFAGRERRQR
jgi:uncharacterized protein (DUF58 family)